MHAGKTETLAAIILAHAAALAHAAGGSHQGGQHTPQQGSAKKKMSAIAIARADTRARQAILVAAPTRQAIHTLLLRIQQRQHHFFGGSAATASQEWLATPEGGAAGFGNMGGVAAGGLQMPPGGCLQLVCVDSGHDNLAAGDGDEDTDTEGGEGEQREGGSGAEGHDDGSSGEDAHPSTSTGVLETSNASTSYATPRQGVTGAPTPSSKAPASARTQRGAGRLQQLLEQEIEVVTNNKKKSSVLSA
jgi:hypothetical protein